MTHACGYEHPSQMQMADVDISCGDNNRVITLENAYNYKKDLVPFESTQKLFECEYLGVRKVNNKLNKKRNNIVHVH